MTFEKQDDFLNSLNNDQLRHLSNEASPFIDDDQFLNSLDNKQLAFISGQPLPPAPSQDDNGLVRGAIEGAADVGEGFASGLTNIGLGALQRINEVGGDAAASVFRNVLPIIRPDLSEQLSQIDQQALNRAIQTESKKIDEKNDKSGAAFKTGQFIGEIAPVIGIGGAARGAAQLAAAGAAAGGASGLLEPQIGEDAEETAKRAALNSLQGASLGAVGGAAFGKAAEALPGALGATSRAAQGAKDNINSFISRTIGINKQAAQDLLDLNNTSNLALLSNRPAVKVFDRLLARFPGSSSRIQKNNEKVIADIQTRIDSLAGAKSVTDQEAGEVIQQGGRNFVGRFKDTSEKLYKAFDKTMPENKTFGINNTERLAQQIRAENANTPSILERIESSTAFKKLNGLLADSKDGKLDFNSIKRHRTLIGDELNKRHLLPSDDEALLSRIYTALSEDMRNAAEAQGAKSLKLFERANNFYREGAEKIENTLQKVIEKDAPEQVFNAFQQGKKLGGTRIQNIMKSLDPDEKEIVRSTVLQRLGQRGQGDDFSFNTFLTNWKRKTSPEAKTALFGKESSQYRKDLDKIVRLTERVQNVSNFENVSKTAPQLEMFALLGGSMIDFGTTVKTAVAANLVSRLMTDQNFVRWMAKNAAGEFSPSKLAKATNELSNIAKNNPDISQDIAKYLTILGATTLNKGNIND